MRSSKPLVSPISVMSVKPASFRPASRMARRIGFSSMTKILRGTSPVMVAVGERQASGGLRVDRLGGASGTSPQRLVPKGGHWTVQVRRHDVDDRQHQEPGGK